MLPALLAVRMQSDYRILCDSGCQPLDEFERCNLGEAPAHAAMSNEQFGNSELGKVLTREVTGDERMAPFLSDSEWARVGAREWWAFDREGVMGPDRQQGIPGRGDARVDVSCLHCVHGGGVRLTRMRTRQ